MTDTNAPETLLITVDGRPSAWLHDGRLWPYVAGGAGEGRGGERDEFRLARRDTHDDRVGRELGEPGRARLGRDVRHRRPPWGLAGTAPA